MSEYNAENITPWATDLKETMENIYARIKDNNDNVKNNTYAKELTKK